jgi:RNase adaptor protein for sRNA GlmZ degradation
MDGIRLEPEVVARLRDRADLMIDTSSLSTADLNHVLTGHFAIERRHCVFLSHPLPIGTASRAMLI